MKYLCGLFLSWRANLIALPSSLFVFLFFFVIVVGFLFVVFFFWFCHRRCFGFFASQESKDFEGKIAKRKRKWKKKTKGEREGGKKIKNKREKISGQFKRRREEEEEKKGGNTNKAGKKRNRKGREIASWKE